MTTLVEGTEPPLVRIEGIVKRFGALAANRSVSLTIPRGAVVGLLGENGAGKTTIMNVLAGLYLPDEGSIEVEGVPLRLGSPRHSLEAGIGMVHQQFKLVETLTAFENISLALDRGRLLQPRTAGTAVEFLNGKLGFDLDLTRTVWQMPLAARQQLEILRTLAGGARILILDEPTSVLSPIETVKLFDIIRRIAESGRSVVLISHKLAEVLSVATRLVVMREGQVVFAGDPASVESRRLARLIVGEREIKAGARAEAETGEAVLSVRNLTVLNDQGYSSVHNVSFDVHAGELVVIAGVTGNGQNELMESIGGLRPAVGGEVVAPRHPHRRGFAYVPARHLGTGLAPGLSIAENTLLGRHRLPAYRWWMRKAVVKAHACRVVERFGVSATLASTVSRLSGGNLQRVVLGRELEGEPRLIVADYPTRGLDLASAAEIRAALVEAAQSGAAVLVSSEELDESLSIASRILVMNRGEIVSASSAHGLDAAELGRLMTMGRD